MLLQLPAGRADRLALDVHVRLDRRASALLEVARRAGGRDILPHRPAAVRARDYMVEGQLLGRPAIDTAEAVAEEQVESRERRIFVGPDELPQSNYARQLQRDAGRVHLSVVMGDDVDALKEHRLDRGLPRP